MQVCCTRSSDENALRLHDAHALLDKGTQPYFYLAKTENHPEARLWNDVFDTAQALLCLPSGTIVATARIEVILAALKWR